MEKIQEKEILTKHRKVPLKKVKKSYTRIDIQENADQHKDYKEKLNKYANDLNSIFGNSGETIQQIFWAFIENEDKCKNNLGSAELKNINFDNCKSLTSVQVEDACNKLENLKDNHPNLERDIKLYDSMSSLHGSVDANIRQTDAASTMIQRYLQIFTNEKNVESNHEEIKVGKEGWAGVGGGWVGEDANGIGASSG